MTAALGEWSTEQEDMYGELRDRIPKEFASSEPLSSHEFPIIDPMDDNWGAGVVYCRFNTGDKLVRLEIPRNSEPLLATAIQDLSRLPRNGYRSAKYLDLYKIYESLESTPEPDFAALRHALAHSPESLNRPSTVERLNILFGTVRVDFSNRQHVKTFWKIFARLLIEVDRLLYRRIHLKLKVFDVNRE